jgi:hypothetical protein
LSTWFLYQYDLASKHGYVYLPGGQDQWYRLNTQTIYRFVEGNWHFQPRLKPVERDTLYP